ncbi:MAG: M24 family metallopeptidase [Betaproteobacteria bacterium]|nr:M24 family metallopeptidase [Betaproteobacteria bacterium]
MQVSKELPLSHILPQTAATEISVFQDRLEAWCCSNGLDAVLVTAQDAFLSEYTPLSANQRFNLSGFTGSTGDGLFLTRALAEKLHLKARFQLFVDGRYHLQADQETSPELVGVHKFTLATGLDEALFSWMREKLPAQCRLAADTQRVGWTRWRTMETLCSQKQIALFGFGQGEVASALQAEGWRTDRKIQALDPKLTGRSLEQNLKSLRAALAHKYPGTQFIYATCMSDDAAWLLNARGYHLPQLSSFLAYTFTTASGCILHLPEESSACPVELGDSENITVTRGALARALQALSDIVKKENASQLKICFSGRAMNAALPAEVSRIFPAAEILPEMHLIEEMRVSKTNEELHSIRQSFLRSSKAIAQTLRWAKECARSSTPLSETQLAARIKAEYGAAGALELSFKTISGFAENGAVIHYSTPSSKKHAQPGDLLLLDSGAYYKEGFATDCTRVALFATEAKTAESWQREIYTLTLKSCLAGLRATFNLDTPCRDIDALARSPLQQKGYDYAHGTGHGIGIHVHENGIRISPASSYSFTEHAVVSVEPGVYLPGKGGVRIENVALVVPREPTPDNPHTHTFENVVWVGYDWDLIDVNLLSEADKHDLTAYERKCQSLGTAVTDCPLL